MFKQRYSTREIVIQDDKLSSDKQAATDFKIEIKQFFQEENISYEQLYSADESGLFWKCLLTSHLHLKVNVMFQHIKAAKNI